MLLVETAYTQQQPAGLCSASVFASASEGAADWLWGFSASRTGDACCFADLPLRAKLFFVFMWVWQF